VVIYAVLPAVLTHFLARHAGSAPLNYYYHVLVQLLLRAFDLHCQLAHAALIFAPGSLQNICITMSINVYTHLGLLYHMLLSLL
jgi:hypothetical protein